MAEPTNASPDRWADWLLRGRERGLSQAQSRRFAAQLRRVRDRVLRGARLRRGHRVLDVGAGTGLLALEACRRLGPSGGAFAIDISLDALRECRRQAEADAPAPSLHILAADALRLPFRDGAFDAVMTRSVLIYVRDRAAAVRELHRVLRPGGRASVFEPINSVGEEYAWNWGLELSALPPGHDRVVAYLREGWEHEDTMLGFDERDLVREFIDAGFSAVSLSYERRYARGGRHRRLALSSLRVRPNPSLLSYEEGARAVLGAAAEEHLARLARVLSSKPLTGEQAAAYVTAVR